MTRKTCQLLAKLISMSSIVAMALAAPVVVPHHPILVHTRISTSTPSGFVNHSFHCRTLSRHRHATHRFKRAAQWTVHAGDTGNKIAAQLGMQFVQLASLNPDVQWDVLRIGSTLNIASGDNDGGYVYTTVAGDTGNKAASANAISFAQLTTCNQNADWYNLQEGQNLYIPVPHMETSPHPVAEPTDQDANTTSQVPGVLTVPVVHVSTARASSIRSVSPFLTPGETSSASGLSISHLSKIRRFPRARVVMPRSSVSTSDSTNYIVKGGDTGYGIATRLGITFDSLSKVNPGVNWINLQIGQSLNIPESTSSTATIISPIPEGTRSPLNSQTSSSSSFKPSLSTYITYAGAITAVQPPYPLRSTWIPFAQLWNMNSANIGTDCVFATGSVPPNSASESSYLKSAILSVSSTTRVDPSFILAMMLQESNGCVRVPTTRSWQGISNPGLMQSFNGRASCNSKGRMQQPCPDYLIKAMISEGVRGVRNVGIVPALLLAAKQDGTKWPIPSRVNADNQTNVTAQVQADSDSQVGGKGSVSAGRNAQPVTPMDDAMLYYQAARIYNSGSLPADGDLSSPTESTRCYVSDVVNRLLGWIGVGNSCSLA